MHIVNAYIPKKTVQAVCNPSGGVKDCQINISSPLLPVNTLKNIAELALRIASLKGSPQLIEWGIRNEEIIIFQSRPVTQNSTPQFKHTPSQKPIFSYKQKLSGIVASPGYAHGLTKLLDDANGLASLKAGEIVVGKHLVPEMVVYLENTAGIVTETGGLTSHAAVIARELDIPAIVSVTNALQHLHPLRCAGRG